MTIKEFEQFKLAYEQLTMQDQNWLFDILSRRTIDISGKAYKVSDLMKLMDSYEEYKDVPAIFRSDKAPFSAAFTKATKELQVIAKDMDYVRLEENEPGAKAIQTKQGPTAAKVDFSFFARVKGEFNKSRFKSWSNSGLFKKMDRNLDKLTTFLNQNGDIHSEEYTKLLDELEKSADAYLTYKVEKGVNKNAIGKVNGATAIKEYIAERRKELFRDKVNAETAEIQEEILPKQQNSTLNESNLAKKEAEYKNTATLIEKYWKKHHENASINPQVQNAVDAAANDMSRLRKEITLMEPDLEIGTGAVLALELVRNEIMASGGQKSPIVENFLADPIAFQEKIEKSEAYQALRSSSDNLEMFTEKSCRENVVDALRAGLPDEVAKNLGSSIVYDRHLIESETEKPLLNDLPTEEASRERAETEEYTTLDMVNAYENLVSFAKTIPKKGKEANKIAEKAAEYKARANQLLNKKKLKLAKLKSAFNQKLENGIVIDDDYRDEDEDSYDEDELEVDEYFGDFDDELVDNELEDDELEDDELEDDGLEDDELEDDELEAEDELEAQDELEDEKEIEASSELSDDEESEELTTYEDYISKSKQAVDKSLQAIGKNVDTLDERQDIAAKYILNRTVYEQIVHMSKTEAYSQAVENKLDKRMEFLNNEEALNGIKESKQFKKLFSDLKAEDCTKEHFDTLYKAYYGAISKEKRKEDASKQLVRGEHEKDQEVMKKDQEAEKTGKEIEMKIFS